MKRMIALLLTVVLGFGMLAACAGNSSMDSRIVGTWELSKVKAFGFEVPFEKLGLEIKAITFNSGGECSVLGQEKTVKGVKWSFDGETVQLRANGKKLYDIQYENGVLKMTEPKTGAELIFEKR